LGPYFSSNLFTPKFVGGERLRISYHRDGVLWASHDATQASTTIFILAYQFAQLSIEF
jgi:hypothetical protein